MDNPEKPTNTDTPITQPWWARFIRYAKRKVDERAAKKRYETQTDKAARVTSNATVWIAAFTFVSLVVSSGTFVILRSQLKEMHDGSVDTHILAQQAINQTTLIRQQLVGTQAAVLKFSSGFNMEGFFVGLTNTHDVAATGAHIRIHMTPVSLPKALPLGDSVVNEATVPLVEKDKPFAQQWPVPWPQQEFRGEDWPGKRAVRVDGEYSYNDGFGNKISESFCTVWLPRFNIVMKAENAYGGGPVQCEGLESTIRDVWARMKEASQEKKSPN